MSIIKVPKHRERQAIEHVEQYAIQVLHNHHTKHDLHRSNAAAVRDDALIEEEYRQFGEQEDGPAYERLDP